MFLFFNILLGETGYIEVAGVGKKQCIFCFLSLVCSVQEALFSYSYFKDQNLTQPSWTSHS